MKPYGSLVNRVLEHSLSTPLLGTGATLYMWSDRLAGTVTAVSPSTKTVTITEDTVEWLPYPSGYAKGYTPNPNGRTFTARLTKNGTWKSAGMGVTFGRRDAYTDPHF